MEEQTSNLLAANTEWVIVFPSTCVKIELALQTEFNAVTKWDGKAMWVRISGEYKPILAVFCGSYLVRVR